MKNQKVTPKESKRSLDETTSNTSLVRIPTELRDFLKLRAAQIKIEKNKKVTMEKLVAKAIRKVYKKRLDKLVI